MYKKLKHEFRKLKKKKVAARVLSCCLALLLLFTTIVPSLSVFAAQGDKKSFTNVGKMPAYLQWSGSSGTTDVIHHSMGDTSNSSTIQDIGNVAFCLQQSVSPPSGQTYTSVGKPAKNVYLCVYYGFAGKGAGGNTKTFKDKFSLSDLQASYATNIAIWGMLKQLNKSAAVTVAGQFQYIKAKSGITGSSNVLTAAKWLMQRALDNPDNATVPGVNQPINNTNIKITRHHKNVEVISNKFRIGDFSVNDNYSSLKLDKAPAGVKLVIDPSNKRHFWLEAPLSTNYKSGKYLISVKSESRQLVAEMFTTANKQDVMFMVGKGKESSNTNEFFYDEDNGRIVIYKRDQLRTKLLAGAEFEVKNTGTGKIYKITTPASGIGVLTKLPYGIYTIREIKAPPGYKLNPTVYTREVDNTTPTVTLDILNEENTAKIEILKVDAMDGSPLSGINFRAEPRFDAPAYTFPPTDINGKTVSTNIPCGTYTIVELNPPAGYKPMTPRVVTITTDGATYKYTLQNFPEGATGKINLEKKGKMLTGADKKGSDYGDTYTPKFEQAGLEGAEFDIIAKTDVWTTPQSLLDNEEPVYKAGDKVDSLITIAGEAESDNLFIVTKDENGDPILSAEFDVIETKAPTGFILDPTPHTVKLEALDPADLTSTETVTEQLGLGNERIKAKISLQKAFTELETTISKPSFDDVTFGLFACEDIYNNKDELIIEQGSLIQVITLDKDGKFDGTVELPFSTYYVKELSTSDGYRLDETEFYIDLSSPGNSNIEFKINGGNPIVNEPIAIKLLLNKEFEELDGAINSGSSDFTDVAFGIYKGKEPEIIEGEESETSLPDTDAAPPEMLGELFCDENGVIDTTINLPVDDYYLLETRTSKGFLLDKTKYYFEVTNSTEVIEVNINEGAPIINKPIGVSLSLQKEFLKPKNPLQIVPSYSDVTFGIYDESGELFGEIQCNEAGYAEGLFTLPEGRAYAKELTTTEGYVLSDTKYYFDVVLEDGKELILIDINNGKSIENKPITGEVEITKTDITGEKVLEGAEIQILDAVTKKVIYKDITDKKGKIKTNLSYGKYLFKETFAPKGYEINTAVGEFEIKEDGEIVKCQIKDKPIKNPDEPDNPNIPKTGDGGWLALICAALGIMAVFVVVFIKRRKLNKTEK